MGAERNQQAERQAQDVAKEDAVSISVATVSLPRQDTKSVTQPEKAQPKEQPLSALADIIQELNEAIPLEARQLKFTVDEAANRTVVSVIDQDSGEVIRQLPSEEALELAKRLREQQEGAEKAIGVLVNSMV
ncbi:hypothetical protein CWE15_06385 [Aliidiomarina taiwanensis]|uniref:Flagellar biosynthesis protein FlaG n=2 Tax=Aliidiomarina taiwanensis TaxID=946228 RepID=A0A432X8F4_9GAMM|nr:hypothetical protein CWE15_06385 [Aliidiomarina taiwanensis]